MFLLKDNTQYCTHSSWVRNEPPGTLLPTCVTHRLLPGVPHSQGLMGKNHKELQEAAGGETLPSIALISSATYPAQSDSSAPGESTSCRQRQKTRHRTLPLRPALNLSWLAIRLDLQGTVLETELNLENKNRLKRRDRQAGAGWGAWGVASVKLP